jgi:hypothetical protein
VNWKKNAVRMAVAAAALLMVVGARADGVLLAKGEVHGVRAGHDVLLTDGLPLNGVSEISVGPGSEIVVDIENGGKLLLRAGAAARFEEGRETFGERHLSVRLLRGAIRFVTAIVNKKTAVHFLTSNVSIGLRGTDIDLVVLTPASNENAGTYLRVNSGEAEMRHQDGKALVVEAAQTAYSPARTPHSRGLASTPAVSLLAAPDSGLFTRSALDDSLR